MCVCGCVRVCEEREGRRGVRGVREGRVKGGEGEINGSPYR